MQYHAFGLNIVSDIALPTLLPQPTPLKTTDVHIQQAIAAPPSPARNAHIHFRIPALAEFHITHGTHIHYIPEPHMDEAYLRVFLLGSCMGALLHQRGYIVLHGNAISHNKSSCEIYVGNQGAGKSTTAAYYLQQGALILADDVCAIAQNTEGAWELIPSFPQIKLWQQSADLLKIDTSTLTRISHRHNKFIVPTHTQFVSTPMPIDHISVLVDNTQQSLAKFTGQKKLQTLLTQTYRAGYVKHMNTESSYIKQLLAFSSTITVSEIQRPQL